MPLIPLAPGTQEAVSGAFAQPGKGQSFGDVLDAMLAARIAGQKQVSDAFEAITRGNPALAQFLAAQPGFVEGLTARPSLRGKPPGPEMAKKIQEGTAKFSAMNPEDADLLSLTPQQFSEISQDALKDLNLEGLDPESQKNALRTYFTVRTTKHPEARVAAAGLLAEHGVLPKETKGIAADVANVMDLVAKYPEEMARLGIASEVDAFKFLRDPELKNMMLRMNIALAQLALNKGEDLDPTIMRNLRNDRDTKVKRLAEVKSELEQIKAVKALPAEGQAKRMAELAAQFGFGEGTGPEAEKGLQEEEKSLNESIAELDALLFREKKKGGAAPKPAPDKRKPIDELADKEGL